MPARHGILRWLLWCCFFYFIETGTVFVKDGKTYHIPNKRLQSEMAFKAQVNHVGKPMEFHLTDPLGFEIEKENEYLQ